MESPEHVTHNTATSSAHNDPSSIRINTINEVREVESQKEVDNHDRSLKKVSQKRKRESITKDTRKSQKMKGKEATKTGLKSTEKPVPTQRRKVSKERACAHEKKYRERMKARTGFTSVHHARMHTLRHLEKIGKLTPAQEKALSDHRKTSNLRTQQWRKKRREFQNSEKKAKTVPGS